jgi:hypothetical protein
LDEVPSRADRGHILEDHVAAEPGRERIVEATGITADIDAAITYKDPHTAPPHRLPAATTRDLPILTPCAGPGNSGLHGERDKPWEASYEKRLACRSVPAVGVDGRGGCGDGVERRLGVDPQAAQAGVAALAISIGSAIPASAKCVSRECRSWCNVQPPVASLNTSAARR